MGLIRLALACAAGFAFCRYVTRQRKDQRPAFAKGEDASENFAQVRNAGPQAMRDAPPRWEKADEASDESFPASDPPAAY